MDLNRKLFLSCLAFCICSVAHAQIEVARIQTKNLSAFGFGAFLNIGVPVNETDAVTPEAGFYYFGSGDSHAAVAPLLVGYRHLLTGPIMVCMYNRCWAIRSGATDIQKTDVNGNLLYKSDGNQLDQKMAGPTTGIGFGYLFEQSGIIRFNIGVRYERAFVSGDPAVNIFSLRISHSFSFGRRD